MLLLLILILILPLWIKPRSGDYEQDQEEAGEAPALQSLPRLPPKEIAAAANTRSRGEKLA